MALTIPHPHLHNPHTISENFMISAVGIAVAALAAVGVYQIGVNNFQPDATTTGSSYLQTTATPVNTFSPELARANAASAASAASAAAFSPELARVNETTTQASATQTAAGPNPAENSARGSQSVPAQTSAVTGPR